MGTPLSRQTGRAGVGATLVTAGVICAALAAPVSADDPFLRHTVTVQAVKAVGPAVVNITTERVVQHSPFGHLGGDPFFDRFFRDFFEPRLPQKAQSLGSGVIINEAGHILTNEHVVARASRIQVALADGREFEAQLIGADANNDIAVLLAQTEQKLPWVDMGTSGDLMVGEPVIAIGNPFGLSSTVTTGVISALDRSIRTEQSTYHGFLQTDASINPGNSGGPLLNAHGHLVAINTAVYQSGQGIGFAIPIDTAARIVKELIEDGEVSPVWLGIDFQDLTPELVAALRLPPDIQGALVNQVRRKSPANRAGVRRGDVVKEIDRRPIASARDFFERLDSVVEEQQIEILITRDGDDQTLAIVAEEVPARVIDALVQERLGLELQARGGGGFTIQSVRAGSGAARIGLQAGDLLLAMNGRPLEDVGALRRSALDLRGRSRALVVVQRGAGRYHVTIPLA